MMDEEAEGEEVDEEADLKEELADMMFLAKEMGLSPRRLLKSPEYSHLRKLYESIHDEE